MYSTPSRTLISPGFGASSPICAVFCVCPCFVSEPGELVAASFFLAKGYVEHYIRDKAMSSISNFFISDYNVIDCEKSNHHWIMKKW